MVAVVKISCDVTEDVKPLLSIVVPVYNEAENMVKLYDELTGVMDKMGHAYEVIFVDDGSADGSFGILSDLCKRSKHLRVIRLRRNSGQSAAMSAGFDTARGEYIVTMDGDLQNDPADIPMMLGMIEEGYDVVCGWRTDRKDTMTKKLFSRFSNAIRRSLIGDDIHDYGCTLRVYKRECIEDFELYGEMHRYIPALMRASGFLVGEAKVNHRERFRGESKYNWKRLLKGFSDLIVVTFWNKFATRPMHIFGTTGLIIMTLGTIVSVYLVGERLFFNIPLGNKPLFTLSILSILFGLQFLIFGILADISLRTYYHQKKFKNYRIEKILDHSKNV